MDAAFPVFMPTFEIGVCYLNHFTPYFGMDFIKFNHYCPINVSLKKWD